MTEKRTIVVPIKCSTVKRWDGILNRVCDYMLVGTVFAFVAWSATLNYRYVVAPYSFADNYALAACMLIASWCGCILIAAISVYCIYKLFSHIECIKDEPENS